MFETPMVTVEGVTVIQDGKRVKQKEYFHVIKKIGNKKYALRTNGKWFKIGVGGGLPMDCAFTYENKTADVWDMCLGYVWDV
jgi:hypothetical protein